MIPRRAAFAAASVAAVAVVAIWGWSLQPEHAFRWMFAIFALPAMWLVLERTQGGTQRDAILAFHRVVIGATGALVALRTAAALAFASGLVDPGRAPSFHRAHGILMGLCLAAWGNYLPKIPSPWPLDEEWFDWQRVHRFVGWLAALTGLALAATWLALPLALARPATFGLMATFVVLAVGRKWLSVLDYSRRSPPPPPLEAGSDPVASDP